MLKIHIKLLKFTKKIETFQGEMLINFQDPVKGYWGGGGGGGMFP